MRGRGESGIFRARFSLFALLQRARRPAICPPGTCWGCLQGSALLLTDGDSRIMISKALNLSDDFPVRQAGKTHVGGRKATFGFSIFEYMEGASAEELDEFLVRYNMNGSSSTKKAFKAFRGDFARLHRNEARQTMARKTSSLFWRSALANP